MITITIKNTGYYDSASDNKVALLNKGQVLPVISQFESAGIHNGKRVQATDVIVDVDNRRIIVEHENY
jgi:hypothetical protein